MGTREILLLCVLPFLVWMIFASMMMIDRQIEAKRMSKVTSRFFRYFAILCPPLSFICLKIRNRVR